MFITLGPAGAIIRGNVLDANQKTLDDKLRDIDSQLYTAWDPTGLRGHGVWHLRRRPETKSVYDYGVYAGNTYCRMEYIENGINHIKDMAFLDYRILDWVKSADLWTNHGLSGNNPGKLEHFKNAIERAEKEHKAKKKQDSKDRLKYEIMQTRSAVTDLRNRINAGVDPNLLGKYWNAK